MTKHFVRNVLDYEVLTNTGWQPFAGVSTRGENPIYVTRFSNGAVVESSPNHEFVRASGRTVRADKIKVGARILSENGVVRVEECGKTDRVELTYTLVEVGTEHFYFTNGILSKNCEFVSDEETLISPLALIGLKSSDPIFYTGTVRWYEEPLPNHAYVVALDPSLGTGGDYSAIQVFRIPEMVQVAEWRHNHTDTRGQVRILLQTLMFLDATLRENVEQRGEPEIFWTVENNTLGEAVLLVIEDTGEDRFPGLFVSERKRKGQPRGRFRKGMNTTAQRKIAACARVKSLIESGRAALNSALLIREFKNFVAKESSFSAKPGETDDLVMAMLLIVRALDVALYWGADAGDLREYISDDELEDTGEGMPIVM